MHSARAGRKDEPTALSSECEGQCSKANISTGHAVLSGKKPVCAPGAHACFLCRAPVGDVVGDPPSARLVRPARPPTCCLAMRSAIKRQLPLENAKHDPEADRSLVLGRQSWQLRYRGHSPARDAVLAVQTHRRVGRIGRRPAVRPVQSTRAADGGRTAARGAGRQDVESVRAVPERSACRHGHERRVQVRRE